MFPLKGKKTRTLKLLKILPTILYNITLKNIASTTTIYNISVENAADVESSF